MYLLLIKISGLWLLYKTLILVPDVNQKFNVPKYDYIYLIVPVSSMLPRANL
jgi:hypothetical protein